MPKRRTEEEVIVGFFQTASLDKAQTVFNIVRGTLRNRVEAQDSASPKSAAPVKKARKKSKVNSTGTRGKQTDFPGKDAEMDAAIPA